MPEAVRRRVRPMRVGRFGSVAAEGPAMVPIVFVLLGDTIYHVIDAKPKRVPGPQLRRVRTVNADPRATVLVDHYAEDWTRLWFAALEGTARVLRDGDERARAITALRRKYPQYQRLPIAPNALVIALDVKRCRYWQASPAGEPARRESQARRSGLTRSRLSDRRTGSGTGRCRQTRGR